MFSDCWRLLSATSQSFSMFLLRNGRSIKPRVAKENGGRELVADMHRAHGIIIRPTWSTFDNILGSFGSQHSKSESVSVTFTLASNKAVLQASLLITIHEAEPYFIKTFTASNHLLFFSVHTGLLLCLFSLSLGFIGRKQTLKFLCSLSIRQPF